MTAGTEKLQAARREVVLASVHLLYAWEAYGGRLTASDSYALDAAEDRVDGSEG